MNKPISINAGTEITRKNKQKSSAQILSFITLIESQLPHAQPSSAITATREHKLGWGGLGWGRLAWFWFGWGWGELGWIGLG